MGATAADTQREIEEIRKDVSSAARELRHRIRRFTDLRSIKRAVLEHPAALVGVGVGVAGVGGVAAARAIAERRRQRQPQNRIRRVAQAAAEGIGERIEQVREALPSIPVEVRFGTQGADGQGGEPAPVERSDSSVVKKMLWGGLVAGMMALGGLLARRASTTIWRSVLKEEPPTKAV